MRFVSLRRAVPACVAAAATLAFGVPGVASAATPKPDVLQQCSGAQSIQGEGSTFQAPAEFYWTGVDSYKGNELLESGFNHKVAAKPFKYACAGQAGQGSLEEPKVDFNQEEEFDRGSGSCLKTWGAGINNEFHKEIKNGKGNGEFYPRVNRYPFCGTDEAPSEAVKKEFEQSHFMASGGEGEYEGQKGAAIESIPIAQGAVAIIVHLPSNCAAKGVIFNTKGKEEKLGRLALERTTVEELYKGGIRTWKQVLAAQSNDSMTCTGGAEGIKYIEGGVEKELTGTEKATGLEEEEEIIRPVVRNDKSGTTHIFKSFLEQVSSTEPQENHQKLPMEEFEKVYSEKPCSSGTHAAGEVKEWVQVAEGCENQRWPEAAHVLRPEETGNPGVVNTVNNTQSTVGYADLAVAQELGHFTPPYGGEEKKGEQHKEFWAPVQASEPGALKTEYADPSSQYDKEKEGDSSCKGSKYIPALGSTEKVPPASTRLDWSKVKAYDISTTYPICGLTYVLAARQYWYFLEPYFAFEGGKTLAQEEEESKKIATTVHNYVQWVVEGGGGGKAIANHDYEKLTSELDKKALLGAEEIGSKIG